MKQFLEQLIGIDRDGASRPIGWLMCQRDLDQLRLETAIPWMPASGERPLDAEDHLRGLPIEVPDGWEGEAVVVSLSDRATFIAFELEQLRRLSRLYVEKGRLRLNNDPASVWKRRELQEAMDVIIARITDFERIDG